MKYRLDEAAQAYPGPDAAVWVLSGLAVRLVERLADVTGEDREQLLNRVFRWPPRVFSCRR